MNMKKEKKNKKEQESNKKLVSLAKKKLPVKRIEKVESSIKLPESLKKDGPFIKASKKEKKELKKMKKLRSLVKKTFPGLKGNKEMIRSIAGSIRLNKVFLKKEKKGLKEWQETYYQELFTDFKKLVNRHNEIYNQKVSDLNRLNTIIKNKNSELMAVESKIARLKKESASLEK
jgi:hypothetical protein